MSEEDKELLARISQLAGQINRHKNQQAGSQPVQPHHPAPHRRNVYRQTGAPYHGRGGHRGGRPPAVHRHRTLHLNQSNSGTSTPNEPSSTPTASGWVSKTDRHRQLINANVFEKESQNRSKAIEETRQRKLKDRRNHEKSNLKDFLRHQANHSGPVTTGSNSTAGANEIMIGSVRFHVLNGGKKLVKAADDRNSASATPKTTVISGVKFRRTKTGNLVPDRIIQHHRRSGVVKKVNQRCKTFSTTGSCPKGPSCRFIHDPDKVALCKDFLKDGKCLNGESCDLSHDFTPERVPNCLHYAKGNCTKPDCPFTHSQALPSAPVCEAFGFNNYCDKGACCTERHVFECPNFSNAGVCKIRGCKLLHRERASVLRNLAKQENGDEDLSSDDESVDSDDIDSDEVAEFIEAESDDSDYDNADDFIPL